VPRLTPHPSASDSASFLVKFTYLLTYLPWLYCFSKYFTDHMWTAPGYTHVKFEVRSFNRFGEVVHWSDWPVRWAQRSNIISAIHFTHMAAVVSTFLWHLLKITSGNEWINDWLNERINGDRPIHVKMSTAEQWRCDVLLWTEFSELVAGVTRCRRSADIPSHDSRSFTTCR